jgi:hypothetical protein
MKTINTDDFICTLDFLRYLLRPAQLNDSTRFTFHRKGYLNGIGSLLWKQMSFAVAPGVSPLSVK